MYFFSNKQGVSDYQSRHVNQRLDEFTKPYNNYI